MKISKLIPILLFLPFMPLHAQKSGEEIDRQRTKVEEAFIQDLYVISTAVIESTEDLPKHILIRGYTMPSIYFLMRFPVDGWNGKLFMNGCGLGCGTLPTDISGKLKKALQRGYATATMNSGHWATSARDFTWADNNPQAEEDFAYRAVHEAIRAAKALVGIFYNREASYSYFWGCSTGGRQAAMAAARYPKDFDGIISEGPVFNWTNLLKLHAWFYQTNTGPDGKEILTKEDLSKIEKAVYNTCDKADGKVDGLVNNPNECKFDPEILNCQDKENCLSPEQVQVLKKWYQGPVTENNKRILTSGMSAGSEPFWGFWFLGESNIPFDGFIPSEEMVRYLYFKQDPGANYSLFDFDFNSDKKSMDDMGDLLNVDYLSLQSFKENGGKFLLYHGLADPVIPYQFSVDYFNQNYEGFGEDTMNFFRLFLVPGMDHCTAFSNLGITDNSVDPLTALEAWVEKNSPPKELPVTRYETNGSVQSRFTVPLYKVKE